LGSSSSPHVDHGPDQIAHHVVKVPVRRDGERQSQLLPGRPRSGTDVAPVAPLGLAGLREGSKRSLSHDELRTLVESFGFHGVAQGPAPRSMKRRGGLVRLSESIDVRSSPSVEPGVEVPCGAACSRNPDVPRENRVEGGSQVLRTPPDGNVDGGDLARRVHPAVGSPGSDHRSRAAREPFENGLDLTLHGTLRGLHLPAVEVRAVVVDGQPKTVDFLPWRHGRKGRPGAPRVKRLQQPN